MATAEELNYDTRASATEMAETIFGEGVTVVSASYSGDKDSSAIYSGGDTITPGVTPSDTGVILSTGDADDFTNSQSNSPWASNDPNQSASTSTNTSGVNNDPDMNAAVGTSTFDGAYLDVDFIPEGDMLTMDFVFASEEYPEYTGTIYNDAVVVWVNGEQVPMNVSGGEASIDGVNDSTNQNLYIDNTGDAYNTEMDGFTVTMSLTMPVIPGEVNSIRIGIADVGDSSYDSNLLIAGGSVQTAIVAMDDEVNVHPDGSATIDVLANDSAAGNSGLTVTHINGIPVTAGDVVTLSTGQQVQLNADGTLTVVGDGDEEDVIFTYTMSNNGNGGGNGNSDTAFVTIHSVPCFVAGTMIATDRGEVPVETLEPGDLVHTLDGGLQPLRWIGRRAVPAEGKFAPIWIAANTFGRHRSLQLSPQHRIMMQTVDAELLFGEGQVLVKAKDLIDNDSVTILEGGRVEYVHIMFDEHQIVFANGLECESFLPGPQTTKLFEQEMIAEICALFPELDPNTGAGYSPAARRSLKGYEARLLSQMHQQAACA